MDYKDGDAHAAAIQGNLVQVKKLDESGYLWDKQDKFGDTPLMESIMYGHRNVAGFLIDKVSPATMEMKDRNNWNALHLMAKYGRPWRGIWNRIVENAPQCLVQKDTEGRTPIELLQLLSSKSEGHALLKTVLEEDAAHAAAVQGNLIQVKKLEESGYPLDKQDKFGETPLMESIMYGHRNVAGFLIDKVSPASTEIQNTRNNWNALHLMAKYGRPWRGIWNRIVENAPQCLVQKDTEGRTPTDLLQLLSSKSEGHASLKSILDEDYITSRAKDLVINGDLEEVKQLYSDGYPLKTQNLVGQTSLMLAIKHRREDIAKFLAKIIPESDVSIEDNRSRNALHYLAMLERPWKEVWQILSQKCPQLLYKNDEAKMSPMELVIMMQHKSSEHKSLYEYVMKNDLPRFVRELDEEAIRSYLGGLEEHAEETRNIKMMFIGHAMVGKTCLVKQLFGEHIDLQSHHSTNVAELHLRRLLLDMLTLERITGTSAKDIVLERLRMVSSKIKEDNRRIEPVSGLIKECKNGYIL
ncbi:serine/threonine-protein phosphatase 6 regulatory ankyrin repeat subunit B-like [Pecten maximus]|uniref:serine/threonine-protein phosphatase 6 regulatory ankyrin repeat subunit B-like n=1 Tax=Pecten maximus TaxID=6579 RepID=UPI001458FE2B|nr:serine/threonine-protein phosphatase 6 regulatory ankyrin repeat subunit B-like [Pecten maximus]